MNIGFVSTWFERGAAYVTKAYIEAIKDKHDVFVYARGGEEYAKGNPNWDGPNVTWGLKLQGTSINFNHIKKWLIKNGIQILFFNEQIDMKIVARIKKLFSNIKLGSYIDYYKEDTVRNFLIFDFLICNTKRHYSVFKYHPQCYYVPWGTDVNLFRPREDRVAESNIVFFHSLGMSNRKGTDLLIETFINYEIYKKSHLIIHSQIKLLKYFNYDINKLKKFNITIIEETVTAPGLYHMGDVYVYPTKLEGIGLTIYEALSCGLPVITTDYPPMNEIVSNQGNYLVKVDKIYARSDGYYWPYSVCNQESLAQGMSFFINNKNDLPKFKEMARKYAIQSLNWKDRYGLIVKIFEETETYDLDYILYNTLAKKNKIKEIAGALISDWIIHYSNYIFHIISTKFAQFFDWCFKDECNDKQSITIRK